MLEDGRIGDKKLLVAGSNERYRKICGRIQLMSKNEEQDGEVAGKLKLSEVPEKPWTHLTVVNIRDAKWNLFVFSHSAAGQVLRDLADSYSLVHSIPVLSVLTHYLDI